MSGRRKVLIITYYWPPAGGITVLRCLKIAKYLRDFGWEPVIYTASYAQYPYLDEGNLKDVPEGITILRQPIREPLNLFKRISGRKPGDPLTNIVHVRDRKSSLIDRIGVWVRGNLFIPDARAFWVRPSVRFLVKWLRENPVDAIFSDGPPHTNTLIACRVKRATGIPWLADFQDPWTQVDYYRLLRISKWADRRHKALEQEVFQTADAITIASHSWKRDLESIGARNVDVLHYGYDEADFAGIRPERFSKFTIVHAGLLGFDRSPDRLIEALARLADEIAGFREDLNLLLFGEVDYSVRQAIEAAGLSPQTTYAGTVPRKSVLEALAGAHILLLPLNKAENVMGRIPGKIFEYIGAGKPVLGLGPAGSDAAGLLQEFEAGRMFEYDDRDGIRDWILERYQDFRNAGRGNGNRGDTGRDDGDVRLRPAVTPLTNRELTRKVAEILDSIVKQARDS